METTTLAEMGVAERNQIGLEAPDKPITALGTKSFTFAEQRPSSRLFIAYHDVLWNKKILLENSEDRALAVHEMSVNSSPLRYSILFVRPRDNCGPHAYR